ncbi:prephenate dehydratase [Thioalbus denitrificans]|jgi:chorismate mutase/prephenate dehydratase|uniref:Bifunctional chorismate mutase/prephenate dehydratase n=1 Tax=Thioalbus denitrificans TaxID=547122 RepID=A0A369CBY6_9GAMM|nr:prephenate dehydratase [Thioalbus denitrificans]RCX30655.1 chorismate mutase [Thioalbus denitrificans]
MNDEQQQLEDIRQRIDALDQELQTLINERARCAQAVAHIKERSGTGGKVFFYRPEREAQVLRRILDRNAGPLSAEEVARLFREIMSACLALEQPMKIAYLGPEGTFTQAAALKHFGHSVISVPLGAIDEVFREVESGNAHYGVVPVENSTEGVVNHTLDTFMNSPLQICGEVEQRIHHHLLSREPDIDRIRRVYSHQQSLAQCREWLDAHLPRVERIDVSSNAEAARRAAVEEGGVAAIAGDLAAERYELPALVRNIEDEPDNTTRFLIIGKQSPGPSGKDKTSLLISAPNKPGALYRLLDPLFRHQISMTRIESRPSRRGMWDYVFFIDILGHAEDAQVAKALGELDEVSTLLKVLGSYPMAVM